MPKPRKRRKIITEVQGDKTGEAKHTTSGATNKKRKRRQSGKITIHDVEPETLGKVCVGAGMTKSQEVDYDSCKVFVSATLPSLPDRDSMDATKNECSQMLQEWLEEEWEAAKGMYEDSD